MHSILSVTTNFLSRNGDKLVHIHSMLVVIDTAQSESYLRISAVFWKLPGDQIPLDEGAHNNQLYFKMLMFAPGKLTLIQSHD